MNRDVALHHLRYFLAVAETLHFTQAAQRLGISQPVLSQQVRRLEALLKCALLVRTTRGVQLTVAGQALAERARTTLDKIRQDLDQVQRLGRGEQGTLTVSFAGSTMFTDLPKVIDSFRRRYPGVELRLREMVTASQLAGLLDGTLDLAFLRDGDETGGIEQRTLRKERYIAVLPRSHALARKKAISVRELRDQPFVLFARHMGPLAYDRTMACCERKGFRPIVAQEAPQWLTVARLVGAGIGVSLAPACVASLNMPGIAYRPIRETDVTTVDLARKTGDLNVPAANFARLAEAGLAQ